MQRGWLMIGAAMMLLCLGAHGQESKRHAIPSKDAQAKAEALIQEVYKDEFSKARNDPAALGRLALTLLQEGKDTTDLIAGRYRLFVAARDLAAQAGDAPTALQAIDELALDFQLRPEAIFTMKIGALEVAGKSPSAANGHQTVVDTSLALLEEALALDDYDAGLKLLDAAENAGKKLKNVPLVAGIRKRHDEVEKMRETFARWKPFADRLVKNPDDPQASQEMGAYYALMRGNWERGLPLLARTEGPFQALARRDLAEPQQFRDQLGVADGWHAIALREPRNQPLANNALLRAYHWYQQALSDADAASRTAIEKKLQEITERLPAELRIGEIAGEWKRCEGHFGPVYAAAFSPDGRKAVSAGADGVLRLWDTRTGKELRRLEGHSGRVWTVAFAPDGRRVVSGGFDGSVRVWDLVSGREQRRFNHADYVRSAVFSHDGRFILSGGDDKVLRLWSLESGKEVRSFKGHGHYVWDVALSRDGKLALSASLDKTVRLWDVEKGEEVKGFLGHKDTVLSVAFSPDGRRALSGSTDKTLILWNLETGQRLRTFTGHKGYVHSVAFSPDGRRALSAGQDHTVGLWDVSTGELVRTLEGHRDQVWHITFSRDGRLALSAGQDQTVRIWGGQR
jgi:WD40 repeat protein